MSNLSFLQIPQPPIGIPGFDVVKPTAEEVEENDNDCPSEV